MKRTLALLLALACVFSLTGCRTREERQTMRRQLDYANGTLEPDLPDHLETEDGTTLDEQVIYDKKGVTITALGIYEDTNYYYIPFSFRNNSKEDLSWFVDAITVNGWISFGWLEDAEQVVHGGLDYNTLRIDRDSLSAVLRPGRITGSFVLEDENWTTVSFSLTTSAGEGENKPFDVQVPVWSQDDVSLYLTGMRSSSYELVFSFYLENQSKDACSFDVEEDSISLNGSEESLLSGWGYVSLPEAGKKSFDLRLDWDELEALGMDRSTPLTTLSFTATVSLDDDWENIVPINVDLTLLKN